MANFTEIKPFRWWCHKILPLVYDDSLSYYELLCKVSAKMNEIIGQYDSFAEAIEALDTRITAVEGLDERVDEVESDLSEVEEKLEQLLYEMKGGTQGQVLAKSSGADWDFDWITVAAAHGVPSGGSAGDILAKATGSDYDVEWVTSSESHGVPSGGTSGQVLAKASNTDYDVEWVTGGGSGPEVVQTTGQSTTRVMSQKAVTDELDGKADADALDDYVAIADLAQTTGQSTTATMSQKAITDAIGSGGLDDKMDKENPDGSGNMTINGSVGQYAVNCVAFGEGYADGVSTFAIGDYTQVDGNYSAGIGLSNHVDGDGCLALGTANNVEANWSAALGTNLKVFSNDQVAVGSFNVADNANANAFMVGGGATEAYRKNLLTVKKTSGDLRITGDVYIGCSNDSTGGTKLTNAWTLVKTMSSASDSYTIENDYNEFLLIFYVWDGTYKSACSVHLTKDMLSQITTNTHITACGMYGDSSASFMKVYTMYQTNPKRFNGYNGNYYPISSGSISSEPIATAKVSLYIYGR